ncbi:MAG: outer membrane protein assembly factor BamA [Muribaculaceae bacterium]|nr:outer membrane protein assembly factor BamA [Muribaculaceae bacterium]
MLAVAAVAATPIAMAQTPANDTIYAPDIIYSPIPRVYEIAGIKVTGVPDVEDYVIIGYSGLSVGERVEIPGEAISTAVKRFYRQGLYSKVEINLEKTVGDKAWLEISLKQQPRMAELRFTGVKGGEKKDLLERLGVEKGQQLTPNIVARIVQVVKQFYSDKGFKDVIVTSSQQPDLSQENYDYLTINVDRQNKVKVHKIYVNGNQVLSDRKLKNAMKKTNENHDILNLFKQKKFVDSDYADDKIRIIDKYNELGYRDAEIVSDSIVKYNDKEIDIYLTVDEGNRYYIKDINWVGNTLYSTDFLNQVLGMYPGDVYNQKRLSKRTSEDDDAVSNLYLDNGYLFFNLVPIEQQVAGDSISLLMRIYEGQPARINKVVINGNDQLYEKVIRRELRVKPGDLFSKTALMNSAREIAASGHFDPETMGVNPLPNDADGTVDIVFDLEQKANDKVQLSLGWGQTGVTGQVALSFSNFSIKNLFNPSSYRGIIPRGDGQTFSISAQTNAKYYQSYNISFFDPWLGGKRPNSFSFSVDYSRSTGVNSRFYNQSWMNSYSSMYNYYGYNNGYGQYAYQNAYDPNKVLQLAGVSAAYGTRLNWPDDFFQFQVSLAYRWYYLKNWDYLRFMNTGSANSIVLGLTLSRNTTDQPIYPSRGSSFLLSLQMTPPWTSLRKGHDWQKLAEEANNRNVKAQAELYKWIEYYKVKFQAKTFTPLTNPDGNWRLVMMTKADFALLGSYNKYVKSPFETFYFGGDGMTGSYTYATETVSMRGYENGQFTPYYYEAYAYSKFTFELRFPFMMQPNTTIFALAFAEAGNAWTDIKYFAPFNLKRSAGVGVRLYLSMLGFLGIDWGYGFDKVWGKRGGGNLHFVLGQEF